MATAFNVSVAPSGGDYTTLSAAVTACACNLTSAATLVFGHGTITGTITDGGSLTGLTSGATGTCVHDTGTQILIKSITGTFQNGEIVYQTLGVNFITISDAGNSPSLSINISGSWSGGADTSIVDTTGYTSNTTNSITMFTSGTARPNGVYSTAGPYRLETTPNSSQFWAINIVTSGVTLDGLQIKVTANNAFNDGIVVQTGASSGTLIKNCIIVKNDASGLNCGGIVVQNSEPATIENCVVREIGSQDSSQNGIQCFQSGVVNIYNCTVVGFHVNITQTTSGTVNITNNICQGSGSGDYTGTFNTTATNISQDTTSPNTSFRSKTLTFVNKAGGNYNLASTDTAAILQGTNLIGTFTTDIAGATRQATGNWDIGAFLYVAAGITTVPTLLLMGVG